VDRQFLKFWGEFLLNVAEGKRQIEEMTHWIQSDLPPLGELAALFRKCYGLPETNADRQDALWRTATTGFHTALETYAPLWGWVPLDRYTRLKDKLAHLEAEIAEQKRLIKQLEVLLENQGLGHMAMTTRFQNLIADQRQAFEQLMQALSASAEATPENHS
jgi:hypothetical protein